MNGMMEYKGYLGSIRYSDADRLFYGEIAYIRDLVSFEGADVDSLEKSFREAVDDYLELRHELGQGPERPFKGSFNVRTGSELHRRASYVCHCAKHVAESDGQRGAGWLPGGQEGVTAGRRAGGGIRTDCRSGQDARQYEAAVILWVYAQYHSGCR